MNIKYYLSKKLEKVFEELGYDKNLARITFSDREDIAHLQCNGAFSLSKILKQNPMTIANSIVEKCDSLKNEFEISVCPPAFINFKIKDKFFSKIANSCKKSERLNIPKLENPISIVLDYGGANVAKPLHIGHMRSAIIGESLKKLHKFLGNNVISDVHLGDWGLQMGLTIAQLMDDYDMEGYFVEDKPKLEITVEMLDNAYPKASSRKKTDEEFSQRASDITLWLQQKKSGYYDIWKEIRKVSLEMVKQSYWELGVTFDLWNGESSVNDIVSTILDIFVDKKLAQDSEGALVVDVSREGDTAPMPPAIIQKHNGAQMYIITDIATIFERGKLYAPDKILYLTDNRQQLHFNQVFRCVRKAELISPNTQLEHITFGTINGKDGKPFKTRDGGSIKLDDVIDIVTQKAMEKLKENKVENANNLELAKKIGIAALIFGDLINVISKDYIFDIEKFMKFEGKTGPYLQYSAVRINSLLAKSDIVDFPIVIDQPLTRNIIFHLLKFIDSLDVSYRENSLNPLALSVYDLCSVFSTFYNDIKILSESVYEKRQNYLNISKLVLSALTIGLEILGIKIPPQM